MMFVFLLLSCIAEGDKVGQELAVGDKMPEFSIKMDNGETVTAEDLKGNVSLVVFFHTSCKDCQQELPVLQTFYEDFPQCKLVCISREESTTSVADYWKEESLTLPYSAQEDRSIYHLFARQGIPRIYVIDKYGIIRAVFTDKPLANYDDLVEVVCQLDS